MSLAVTLVRSRFGKLLEKLNDKVSVRAFAPNKQEWKGVYTKKKADGHIVRIQDVRGFGRIPMVEENQNIPTLITSEGYTYECEPLKFGGGYRYSEELIDDNRYLDLTILWSKALGKAAMQTKEWEAVKPLNNGYTSYKTPDGVSLFNSAHKGHGQVRLSNVLSTPEEFSEDSIESMKDLVDEQKDDMGELTTMDIKTFVAPKLIQFDVCRVLDSPMQPNLMNNNINAYKKLQGRTPVNFMRRLVHPGRYFVITTDERMPALYQRRAWRVRMRLNEANESVSNVGSERYDYFISSWSSLMGNGAVV